MATAPLDVVGIGNAIVDVIAQADDAFLAQHGMVKSAMALIDEARAQTLYAAIGARRDMKPIEASGGSAANTIAGIASLGGKAGFIGKVRDDLLGDVFARDLRKLGVAFDNAPAAEGPATGQCLVLVTPDANRTMNTFLGAGASLGIEDVAPDSVAAAQVVYLEGYLFDPPAAQAAFRKAADIAHAHHRKVALSLSDSFCVERHRAAFLDLIAGSVDIVFANEAEALSLFETGDIDEALSRLKAMAPLATVTRGAKGAVVLTAEETVEVPAGAVERVVDTTGAGDLYAAGFLTNFTRNASLAECGRLGCLAAAEIISHYGARPEIPLNEYVTARR